MPRSLLTGSAALGDKTETRVLVVEDEPTVAGLISDVLEDEEFHVEALLDGYEALERAARASYDLVICDMKMPGLDGQHFYESLACMGNPLSNDFCSSPEMCFPRIRRNFWNAVIRHTSRNLSGSRSVPKKCAGRWRRYGRTSRRASGRRERTQRVRRQRGTE
jgi:hypothetical protein